MMKNFVFILYNNWSQVICSQCMPWVVFASRGLIFWRWSWLSSKIIFGVNSDFGKQYLTVF